jgi:glycosyltransferase involved in cell wall biosynthesis
MSQPVLCLYTKTWLSSGTGQIAQELATALANEGVRVMFVAPAAEDPRYDAPHPNIKRLRPPRERRDNAPRVIRAAVSMSRVLGSIASLLRARLSTKHFLVTIPDPLVFSLPALALLKLTGASLTYVVHDPEPHAWALPKALRWLEKFGHASVVRLANHVVVLSNAGAATVHRLHAFPNDRIHVIEHGVFDLGETAPAPGDKLLLLYGTIRRNKGVMQAIDGVLKARQRGTPARLLIAGAPHAEDPTYWAACQQKCATAPDAIEVQAGYVTNAKTADLIRRADAFLMPYRDFNSQSGVAILAATNARPAIAAPAGGIGELMQEGMPGVTIAEPVEADQVADAIVAFCAKPINAWNEKSLHFRDHMLATRSWPAIARAYKALIFPSA